MPSFCPFGAGVMGNVHAANIAAHPHAELRCVIDVVPEAGIKLAERYGAEFREDAEQALHDSAVEAVLIASDGSTHAELVTLACQAGKAIFCEKPLDLDLERAESCAREVASAGVPFQIGFHRRFDPSHSALRQALDDGDVGDIELVCITNRGGNVDVPPLAYFKKTPDCMWKDMLIHDFDIARWLLGEEVTGIYAAASCMVDSRLADLGEVDTALVTLTTRNGALCHINASFRSNYGYDQRIEVFGSKAVVALENVRQTSLVRHTREGALQEKPLPNYLARYRDCYAAELDAFITALEIGATPSPAIDDGLRAIRIADAASRSRRGGTPVTVPE